jgi:Mg2+-importing ATPase
MGASSNFGNMFSMTGASLFLPFLPMTPVQILLNNFLYDLSQVTIPTDNIDEDYVEKPRPWDIGFIKKFMLIIGPISSVFDFTTFAVLWFIFRAQPELFHTGWFTESLMTQTLIIHVIRTSKVPFLKSNASKPLLWTSIIVVSLGLILPYTFLAKPLGFVPLPLYFYIILLLIVATYLLMAQGIKSLFIKKYGYQ